MSRKLGQIIAVRENTWMIRIPMGCDPQTKQRSYYNRTVHGSLRQAQKFLGKKVNELGAYIERDGAYSLGRIPVVTATLNKVPYIVGSATFRKVLVSSTLKTRISRLRIRGSFAPLVGTSKIISHCNACLNAALIAQ